MKHFWSERLPRVALSLCILLAAGLLPAGCAGGGGQPIHDGEELAGIRGENLYFLDRTSDLRFSHENPDVQALYKEMLDAPLSHKAHELLHTDHHGWKMPNEA